MNFPTLPYDDVTYSFLLEIWFWGPTHPTFLYDVTLFSLFFFLKSSLMSIHERLLFLSVYEHLWAFMSVYEHLWAFMSVYLNKNYCLLKVKLINFWSQLLQTLKIQYILLLQHLPFQHPTKSSFCMNKLSFLKISQYWRSSSLTSPQVTVIRGQSSTITNQTFIVLYSYSFLFI